MAREREGRHEGERIITVMHYNGNKYTKNDLIFTLKLEVALFNFRDPPMAPCITKNPIKVNTKRPLQDIFGDNVSIYKCVSMSMYMYVYKLIQLMSVRKTIRTFSQTVLN